MKTPYTLTAENAAAIEKYSEIVSQDPNEFLNDLVNDYCTEAFADLFNCCQLSALTCCDPL